MTTVVYSQVSQEGNSPEKNVVHFRLTLDRDRLRMYWKKKGRKGAKRRGNAKI